MYPFNLISRVLLHILYYPLSDFKLYRFMVGGRWEKWRYFYFSHIGTRWINVPTDSIQDGLRPLYDCVGNKALIKEIYGAEVIELKQVK